VIQREKNFDNNKKSWFFGDLFIRYYRGDDADRCE